MEIVVDHFSLLLGGFGLQIYSGDVLGKKTAMS